MFYSYPLGHTVNKLDSFLSYRHSVSPAHHGLIIMMKKYFRTQYGLIIEKCCLAPFCSMNRTLQLHAFELKKIWNWLPDNSYL